MVRTIKYSSANLKYACYNPFPDVLLHYMDKKPFHFLHCTMLNAKNYIYIYIYRSSTELILNYPQICVSFLKFEMVWPLLHLHSVDSLRSSKRSMLDGTIPFCRTAFGHSAFSLQATKQWNTLPDDGRSCSYISTFKSILGGLLKTAQLCTHWSLLHGFHDLILLDKHTCHICVELCIVHLHALFHSFDMPLFWLQMWIS